MHEQSTCRSRPITVPRFCRRNFRFIELCASALDSRYTGTEALFWDNADLTYLRIDRKRAFDYLVMGVNTLKRQKRRPTPYPIASSTEKDLPTADYLSAHGRDTVICTTKTRIASLLVGEVRTRFLATVICATGIPFGTLASMMARDWVHRPKESITDLFTVDRKKIKGSMWNFFARKQ